MHPQKKRALGRGYKSKAMEVHQALFTWFADVRNSLKGCLPHTIFKLKANELYDEYLHKNPTPESKRLKFVNQWIKIWEKEYGISLWKSNKRYSIKTVITTNSTQNSNHTNFGFTNFDFTIFGLLP